MDTQTNSPQKIAIDQGFHAAFETHGYVLPDGALDKAKVRERMFDVLRSAKVLTLQERGQKAITRGAMVEQVFTGLPGPDTFGDQQDPQLAQAIWTEIDKYLWSEARPSAGSALQRLVGINMGNGYFLCRTRIGKDRTSAAYITDALPCLERDFIMPDNISLQRKVESVQANRALLISRQPANADRFRRGFDNQMKALASAAHEQLTLMVESVTAVEGRDPEGDTDN